MILRILFLLCFSCIANAQEVSHRPFVIFSAPKTGTHLFAKILSLIVKEEPIFNLGGNVTIDQVRQTTAANKFYVAHNFSRQVLDKLVKQGYLIIFSLRDPRDQLISMQNWFGEGQWQWIRASRIKNPQAQLTEMITGKRYGNRLFEGTFLQREKAILHLNSKDLNIVRFEDCVGMQGGGSDDLQVAAILNIAHSIGIQLTTDEVEEIAKEVFGGTKTFRKGQIDIWKEHFTAKHKWLFKKLYNHHLIRLGYEKDSNW